MLETWVIVGLAYLGGIYLGLLLCLEHRCNFRDGFWICVGWPVVLIFCILYGLYLFLTYIFYLRD